MIIMKKGHEKTRKFSSTNTINNETFASVRCTCTTTKIQNSSISRLVVLKPDDDHLLSLLIIRKIVIKNCSAMRR